MNRVSAVATSIPKASRPSLAGLRVPSAPWTGALAHALAQLLAHPPRGAQAYRRALAFGACYGSRLTADSTPVKPKIEGYSRDYPLACTLLQLRMQAPLVRTLGWLLLELHLEGVHFDATQALAANLRGLSDEKPDHPLGNTVWECDGLSHLVRKMDFLATQTEVPGAITGLSTFDSNWRKELRGVCLRLLAYSMPTDDAEDDEPAITTEPLSEPSTALLDPLATEDSEEPAETSYNTWKQSDKSDSASKSHEERCTAWAETLHRRSSPEIHRALDSVLPAPILNAERDRLVHAGAQAIARVDLRKAEQCLLHLLALEAGLTDTEARGAVFARVTVGSVVAVDIRHRCLRRPETRPAAAFDPRENKTDWLATGGDTLAPLSVQTLQIAAGLLRLRSREARRQGASNSHMLVANTDRAINRPVSHAIRETRSVAALTAGAYRLRLAAALAEILGSDAAQITFGDSFGLSAAPTYYASFGAAQIAAATVQR